MSASRRQHGRSRRAKPSFQVARLFGFEGYASRLSAVWIGRRPEPFFVVVLTFLLACLMFGGGTVPGFLSDALLQLAAIPVILWSIWRLSTTPIEAHVALAVGLCSVIAVVPTLQLLPLGLGSLSAPQADIYALLGHVPHYHRWTVSSRATALSLASLLVPIGVFLSVVVLSARERRNLSLAVMAFGLASVFLGLFQIAEGPASLLRPFEITNPTEAVGFFANRNHFAALVYCVLVFTGVWIAHSARFVEERLAARRYDVVALMGPVIAFSAIVILIAGQLMARSRAGLALTMLALVGVTLFAMAGGAGGRGLGPRRLLVWGTIVAVFLVLELALYRILDRFEADPLADARIQFAETTAAAVTAWLPFGAGMGTFLPIYAMSEQPEHLMAQTFANRAHNDFLEILLESGFIGLAVMVCGIAWYILRSISIWRSRAAPGPAIDWMLARAAVVVVGLVSLHSFVDYPLRTSAMMALTAVAFGLMCKPVKSSARSEAPQAYEPQFAESEDRGNLPTDKARRGSGRRPHRRTPAVAGAEPGAKLHPVDIGVDWPEQWRGVPPSRRRNPQEDAK